MCIIILHYYMNCFTFVPVVFAHSLRLKGDPLNRHETGPLPIKYKLADTEWPLFNFSFENEVLGTKW